MRLSDYKVPDDIVKCVDAFIGSRLIDEDDVNDSVGAAIAYAAQLKVERDLLVAAVEAIDVAVGNEHRRYTHEERIQMIAQQRDYMARRYDEVKQECDAALVERDSLARRVEALERMVERSAV